MIISAKRLISKRLGELLLEKKIIKQKQLKHALRVQKEKSGHLGGILVSLGYATEVQIAQVLTTQFGFPYPSLKNYKISPKIARLVPRNVAEQYCLIPIDKIGNCLTIAMSDPLNIHAIEDIEFITNSNIQVFVGTQTDINRAIKKCYS